jgi:hypothetical protein
VFITGYTRNTTRRDIAGRIQNHGRRIEAARLFVCEAIHSEINKYTHKKMGITASAIMANKI